MPIYKTKELSQILSKTSIFNLKEKLIQSDLLVQIHVLFLLYKFLFACFFLISGTYFLLFFSVFSILLSFVCLKLCKKKKLDLVRYLTFLDVFLVPIYHTIFLGTEAKVIYYLLCLGSGLFIIFDIKDKKSILVLGIIVLFTGYFWDRISFQIHIPSYEPSEKFYTIYNSITFLMCSSALFICTFWFVQKLEKSREELYEALFREEKNAKLKAEFLSVMSHEIRTPLSSIVGLTDLLLQTKNNFEGNLKTLKSSADNLVILINDVLDFSKIEAGKINFENNPFQISETIQILKKTFELRAQKKKINFIVSISKDVPTYLKGDEIRLKQVLSNLLDNALKFTITGKVELKVYLGLTFTEKARIFFEVNDTGLGINEKKLESIFDGFARHVTDNSSKFEGNGIGLNICKNLVCLQGGEIEAKSTLNVGSTFSFYLDFPFATKEEFQEGTSISAFSQSEFNYSYIKVLLVEDNEINQFVLKQIFTLHKIPFEICSNGIEALKETKNIKFDLILTDYHMPDMNGGDLIKKIQNDASNINQKTPVFMFTADVFSSFETILKDVKIEGILKKPLNKSVLLQKIDLVLSKSTHYKKSYQKEQIRSYLSNLSDNKEEQIRIANEFLAKADKSILNFENRIKDLKQLEITTRTQELKLIFQALGSEQLADNMRETEHLLAKNLNSDFVDFLQVQFLEIKNDYYKVKALIEEVLQS